MLRRCIQELSSGRSIVERHRQIRAQMPVFRSSRSFSHAPKNKPPQGSAPTKETPRSGSNSSKIIIGSVVVGAAATAAYHTGYIDLQIKDEKKSSVYSSNVDVDKATKHLDQSADLASAPSMEHETQLKHELDDVKENDKHHILKDLDVEDASHLASESTTSAERTIPIRVKESELSTHENIPTTDEQLVDPKPSSEGTQATENSIDSTRAHAGQDIATEPYVEQNGIIHSTAVSEESGTNEATPHHDTSTGMEKVPDEISGANESSSLQDTSGETPKDSLDKETGKLKPLAESYSLQTDERIPEVSGTLPKDKEAEIGGSSTDTDKHGDGKVVIDLIEAIDSVRRKQAESDAYFFAEEKRMLKEKFEKQLKDARARELMYAEEAAILDKELNKEKAKAAATIKMIQEKAEQNLVEELQRKEEEASTKLDKVQDLAKAELTAAIAREKSSQIEKMAEANLHINALCMAFYARSEEARQTHSVHKLALGTLALEDALSKGLPIRAEVDALHKSLDGIDRDSLLDLTLTSLPQETLNFGTSTQMQLSKQFDSLKGSLRHFSLIPAGGGGILAHSLAHIASMIKMKEDQSGEGIESLISKVDSFLQEGKIAEAAETLEGGVHGSEAENIIVEWVRQARNRAVAEQALSLLQSYAASITYA